MNLAEYGSHDAVGLAELVRKKQVSPAELAKTALAAVDKFNPKLNAVAELYRERGEALDEASLPEGPFRGVPFMVKPIGITEKGRPVGDLGSNMFAPGELPKAARDCYVVQRFREAGLNIMGRTHLPELAYTITVESPHQGVTHNPWSPDIVAGGSSTGSAVLVAAGVLPMAHASDGAGSTRFPAAVNGVIGMKPSRGRISIGPDVSDISALKISHFAVTRTVRDSAALLDAVVGGLPGESVIYRPPESSFIAEIAKPPGKLRVALSNMMWHTQDLHPEVKDQLNKVGKKLEELGHIVTEDKPDIDFDAYRDMYRTVYYMDGAVSINNVRRMMGGKIDTNKLQPLIQQIIARIGEFTIYDYADAIAATNTLARRMGEFFEKYDVLVTPTLTEPVPRLGEYTLQGNMTPDAFLQKLLGCNQHLPMANLTGVPAISLPVCETPNGTSGGGIPMGLHVFGPMGADARLLRLSAQLEEAMPWRGRKPAIHVSNP